VVHADFDGDANLDYALLLRNNKTRTTKLVVLLSSGNGQYRAVYELDVTGTSRIVYLRPVRAGSKVSQAEAIPANGQASQTKLSSTSIQVSYFEKATVILYWNRKLKKIQEVQTED
jgi:hypothetical protein